MSGPDGLDGFDEVDPFADINAFLEAAAEESAASASRSVSERTHDSAPHEGSAGDDADDDRHRLFVVWDVAPPGAQDRSHLTSRFVTLLKEDGYLADGSADDPMAGVLLARVADTSTVQAFVADMRLLVAGKRTARSVRFPAKLRIPDWQPPSELIEAALAVVEAQVDVERPDHAHSYELAWALIVAAQYASSVDRKSLKSDDAAEAWDRLSLQLSDTGPTFLSRVVLMGSGSFRLRLTSNEREMLSSSADALREVILSNDSPAGQRLRPPAHGADADGSQDWVRLCGDELLASRLDAADTFESCAEASVVSEAELTAMMQSINSLRLVLGTVLNVGEDDEDNFHLDVSGPVGQQQIAYRYLGELLYDIVQALEQTL